MEYSWKPKAWLAVILGILLANYTFLYVNKIRLFWGYFLIFTVVALFTLGIEEPVIYDHDGWKYEAVLYILLSVFVWFVLCPIHAYLIAKNSTPIVTRPWYSTWWGVPIMFVVTILFILVVTIITRLYVFEPFTQSSTSMEPTIKNEAMVIVYKHGYNTYGILDFTISNGEISSPDLMQRGEIYAFYPPHSEAPYIKRLIALPGDSISIIEDEVIVNGVVLATEEVDETEKFTIYEEEIDDKKYLTQYNHWTSSSDMYEIIVPHDSYFFMGDNRDNSNDSRYFGFISNDQIIGEVIYPIN